MHQSSRFQGRRVCGIRAPGALTPLAIAASAACAFIAFAPTVAAQGLPGGLNVQQGQASVNTVGNAMTVTNSSGAILNWQSFSIGAGNSVRFQQPDVSSKVLNRVTGTDPSSILGSLNSNGSVWLLNPNGVLFGSGARVDVAGLVASTLSLPDADWLAGRYGFTAMPGAAGDVVNDGQIRTPLGGRVLLLSSNGVSNDGLIDAPGGQVMLAAGQRIDVVDTGTPNLVLQVTAPQGKALNLGTLSASGGRIDVQAGIVNQQGIVSADTMEQGAHGEVVLRGGESVSLDAGSVTSARGPSGGQVVVDSGAGDNLVAGTVDASGSAGTGGQVRLLGHHVGLLDGARVDASGTLGGGEALVGGGARGLDPTVPNAQATFLAPGATIAADALDRGDGGHIVLWGNDATRAYGTLTARGGAASGNGGTIETSGGWLDARPALVSTAAPHGLAGEWLLDPNDILIGANSLDTNITGNPDFTTTTDAAEISPSTIAQALDSGTNVTITTGSAAPNSQAGDITVAAAITIAPQSPVSLTLNAQRDIVLQNSTITSVASGGAPMSVHLNAGLGGTGTVNASGTTIDTNGGDFTISAPSLVMSGGSFFTAGAGQMTVNADQIQIEIESVLSAGAPGTSILVQGLSTPFVTAFDDGGFSPFSVSGGRWLLYAASPSVTATAGLDYFFSNYGNLAPGALPDAVDNGIVYGVTPTLSLTGTASKTYDQTTAISLGSAGLAISGGQINGDVVTLSTDPVVLTGNFPDANAGIGKTVTLNSAAVSAIDTNGYPVYGYQATLPGDILARALSAAATVADKTYDGTVAATVSGWNVLGVLTGDTVNVAANSAQFSDKNVGTGKSVSVGATLTGADAGNYSLSSVTAGTASITPALLTASATVPDKVYDGTATASIGAWSLSGVVPGETVNVVPGSALFSDPNVGSGKAVSVGATLGGVDSGNYSLSLVTANSAAITPATLTYVAQPVSTTAGFPLPPLSGTVTGFVGSENLSTSTSGNLVFTTTASTPPAPGTYAIDGGGLSATNYVFAQDAGNASALIVAPLPIDTQTPIAPTVLLGSAIHTVLPPPPPPPPGPPPALDTTQGMQPDPQTGTPGFEALPLAEMRRDKIAQVLDAREQYKQSVLANGIALLERDPGLADLPACQTAKQVETGTCLITDALKQELQGAEPGSTQAAVTPSSAPAAAPVATPAPQPGAPSSASAAVAAAPAAPPRPAAAAPAPAPAPAAAAAPVQAAAATALLPVARPVKAAALPEIRRKIALVIGIDRYQDRRIPQLGNAVGDARAIGKTFENALGYDTIVLENADKQRIVATLNRLAITLHPRDSVVVYYAGHGTLVPGSGLGYWQSANADPDDPRTWISNSDIGKLLAQFGASQVALISDSCYSGSLVSGERIGPSVAPLDPSRVLSEHAAVAMSSGGNEPVADEGKQGHSPFAWSLMQSLDQLTKWQPGGNVFERVRFAVAKQLPQRPQYGAAPFSAHVPGTDYLFEHRELGVSGPAPR